METTTKGEFSSDEVKAQRPVYAIMQTLLANPRIKR